jgi:hypothetical protein
MKYFAPTDAFKKYAATAWGLAEVNKTTLPVLLSLRDAIDAMLEKRNAEGVSTLVLPNRDGGGEV